MPDANDLLGGTSQPQAMAAMSQSQSDQSGVQGPGGFFKKILATILSGVSSGMEAGPNAFTSQGVASGFQQFQADQQRQQELARQQKQQQFQNQLASNQEGRAQQEFQTSEQLKQQQLANSVLQNRETMMRLDSMDKEQSDPLVAAAAKHAEKSIENGDGQVIGTSDDINALEQQWAQVHADGGQFLDHEIVPVKGGKEFALVRITPNNTNDSDYSETIPGDPKLGVPDTTVTRKAGTPASTWRVQESEAWHNHAKQMSDALALEMNKQKESGANWRAALKAKTDALKVDSTHQQDKLGAQLLNTASANYRAYAVEGSKRQGWIFDKPETPGEIKLYQVAQEAEKKAMEHLNSPAAKTPSSSQSTSIRVRRKSDGAMGTLDSKDFDPNKYDKVNQ